jgi:hypothetical protein
MGGESNMKDIKYYIKYQIKYSLIHEIASNLNKKRINFFIDLQSIAKGFYNKDVIMVELGKYATDGVLSNLLITELRNFLNDLYVHFKQYDPFFILFYDDGYCLQQKMIDNTYKSGRSTLNVILPDNNDLELFRQIKKYYYQTIEKQFTKPNLSRVYYLKEYEADLIPHYCIMNGLYDADASDVLNIILSTDKDLLQTCEYTNTIQCITSFIKKSNGESGFQIQFDTFDINNAISYFNKKFKRGILTAKHIPIILSISGDKSDEIDGIRGVGYTKAVDLIINNSISHDINDILTNLNNMPDIIKKNFNLIQKNYKMISFEEQIKRTPQHIFQEAG